MAWFWKAFGGWNRRTRYQRTLWFRWGWNTPQAIRDMAFIWLNEAPAGGESPTRLTVEWFDAQS